MSDIIGITMGDPAGVGPEISIKALAGMSPGDRDRTLIYGNRATLEAAKAAVGCDVDLTGRVVDLAVEGAPLPWGKLSPAAGDAAFRFIEKAVRDAEAGRIGCIVTAPINKEALNAAGHHYDGHTGMLRSLTGSQAAYMLLASERLKVIHVSTHVSLKDAIARATTERVLATIRAGNAHLKRIGIESPRIAVAGINPHCGENGLFGTEDDDQIGPAVCTIQRAGSRPAAVATAWPRGNRRPGRRATISRHSASTAGPAARWIAPSTPPPPSSPGLAAFTITSTSASVMSPGTARRSMPRP